MPNLFEQFPDPIENLDGDYNEYFAKADGTEGRATLNQEAEFVAENMPLNSGQLLVGNASNIAQARTISGDISISNTGVTAIQSGVITNADISPTATIDESKLAALTPLKAVATDASGILVTSVTTSTELAYLSGVTSGVQNQINALKASGFTTLIQNVANNTYTLVAYAPCAGTIAGVGEIARALTSAGNFSIAINALPVTGLSSLTPTTTGSYTSATAANTFNRGDKIQITYAATSALLDHSITIDYNQTF